MFYGVDFGANDALAIHGPDGPVTLPRLPRVPGGAVGAVQEPTNVHQDPADPVGDRPRGGRIGHSRRFRRGARRCREDR